jgi:hypothetical protein
MIKLTEAREITLYKWVPSGRGTVKGRRAARQEWAEAVNPQLKSIVLQIQSDRREVASNSQRSASSHPAGSDR